MAGGSRIIAFGTSEEDLQEQDQSGHAPAEKEAHSADVMPLDPDPDDTESPFDGDFEAAPEPDDAPVEYESEADEPARRPVGDWLPASLALLAIAAWTGFFAWASRSALATGLTPAEASARIVDWSMPVALVCVVWLLVTRNSRRQARQFGEVARVLSDESRLLETRLLTVNRELSLARDFIASQSRDLDSLGRIAAERLSSNADRLQDLIRDNGVRVETIGNVSEAALENMEKLRSQLPVISSAAKDVTNNIGSAGRTAHGQLEDMISGFRRINEFGEACEKQVNTVRAIVDESLVSFTRQSDELGEVASKRFAELNEHRADFRTQLEKQEIEALGAIRARAAALNEELAVSRQRLDASEKESIDALQAHLASVRDEVTMIARSLRETEERAVRNWRESIARLADDRDEMFAAILRADANATDVARQRLAGISEDTARLEEAIAKRGEALAEELERRRRDYQAAQDAIVAELGHSLAAMDTDIARRSDEAVARSAELAAQAASVAARMEEYEDRIAKIAARAGDTESRIASSLQTIFDRVADARKGLSDTSRDLEDLTDGSVRLLEIIQASAAQTREDLPESLSLSEDRLRTLEDRVTSMRATLAEAGTTGEALSDRIGESESGIRSMIEELGSLHDSLRENGTAHAETLHGLRQSLTAIEARSEALIGAARGELDDAIAKLDSAVQDAISAIGGDGATSVAALADSLGEASAEAIEKAIRTRAIEAARGLEEAAAKAAGVGREATVQLRDQLVKVNDLVGNLEQRVTQARERAGERVDNDFARRVALITESLNSNAIDIAKALSSDVSDTAWAGYLRGDRGIFTRRAVNLIEANEAREIQQIYESEPDFREHVSRYIHDFEAILREVLSTRDGNALAVTLLSSDMGKLYVALAQAIERLRS